MRKKPYMSKNRLFLGGKRKQKGGFFFPAGLGLGIKLAKKILGGRRKKKKESKMVANRRNNIVLVKRDSPKRVTLPNGITFLGKYKRVNRHYLPGGTTIQRTYRGRLVQGRRTRAPRPRRREKPAAAVRGRGMRGRGIIDVAKTIAANPHVQEFGKKLLTKGIKSLPGLYKKATKRIKNKNFRSIAQSDIAIMMVNEGVERLV